MPKMIFISNNNDRSGISIRYIKGCKTIYISGWYDSFVGIEGKEITLIDFFNNLGITEKEIVSIFKKHKKIRKDEVYDRK